MKECSPGFCTEHWLFIFKVRIHTKKKMKELLKQSFLKTIFIFKSQFTLDASTINHKHQNHFLLRVFKAHIKPCPKSHWTVLPVQRLVQGGISSHVFANTVTPEPTHTFSICPSATVFQYVLNRWVEQEDTQTHKERKSVLTVTDFTSDAGCTMTKMLSLNVFMCSCAALYWQWSPATVVLITFWNCRTNQLT